MSLSLIILSCISCQSKEAECTDDISSLIEKMDVNDIQDLYGFSAESTWRKRDKEGKRSVYRISYSNDRKQDFNIPSFQSFDDDVKRPNDSFYNMEGFASELNYPIEDAEEIAKKYAAKIIEIVNKYDLKAIRSQKHVGDFIEFIPGTGCSVYYKKKGNYLNEGFQKSFKYGYQIKPDWYILRRNEGAEAMIEMFEKAKQID